MSIFSRLAGSSFLSQFCRIGIQLFISVGGPLDICVPQWYTGPCRRISSAWLNDEVPVRGSPAPMTWIWAPGCGTEAFWPIFFCIGGLFGVGGGVGWWLVSGWPNDPLFFFFFSFSTRRLLFWLFQNIQAHEGKRFYLC